MEYLNYVETLTSIFVVNRGRIKILLKRKKSEPYKDYLMLPGSALKNSETLEDNVKNTLLIILGKSNFFMKENHVFSKLNRDDDNRVIAVSYIVFLNDVFLDLKNLPKDYEWFDINQIPKTAYDHSSIIKEAKRSLKERILLFDYETLVNLFPNDFTFSELQKMYEQVMHREIDKRNFRKKFISQNLIEETGYKNMDGLGRPGKLYRFKKVKDGV